MVEVINEGNGGVLSPLYTFLLPAYKAKYLEQTLSSIKCQAYEGFKCIVSDDCSPENIKGIFEKVCGDDARFEYRRNVKNIGGSNLVTHWNLLVNMCDTEYLIMAGDDDLYMPEFLLKVDELRRKHPCVGVIRARPQYIDGDGEVTDQDSVMPEYMSALSFLFYRYANFFVSGLSNYVFRRSDLLKLNGFVDLPMAWGSDEATVIGCTLNGICSTSDVLESTRVSGINLSCKIDKQSLTLKINALIGLYLYVKSFINQHIHPTSLLEQNQLISVSERFPKDIQLSIIHYTPPLGIFEKIRLVKRLQNVGCLNSFSSRVKYILLLFGSK